jgi:acetoin utilization deacetylase AcuC-like enzyme
MTKPVLVRSHPRCLEHRPGLGHPESPARLRAVLDALDGSGPWLMEREAELPPEEDVLGALKWIHDPAHLDRLREASASAPGFLDSGDCAVSSGTFSAAVAAAGVALATALDLVNGRIDRAFLVVRPPSHHAGRATASGWCFVNSVALAAETIARAWQGPVLVVDIDALHGSGTQEIFWERGDVVTVSVHRYPGFPGTGGGDEIGAGAGEGANRNVPLAIGSDDATVQAALEGVLDEMVPLVRPVAMVVSAGFGGHASDPVGGFCLTAKGYFRITRALVETAERWCGGRILSVLEGGVDLKALAECALVHVAALAGDAPRQPSAHLAATGDPAPQ